MSTQTQPPENFLREILSVVFAQKRLIVETALIIFAVVLLVAFLAPKKYLGQAALMVKAKRIERNPEMVQQLRERSLPISREDLNSELQILTSSAVLKRTALEATRQHGIFGLGALLKTLESGQAKAQVDDLGKPQNPGLTKAISKLKSKLDVLVVPSSNVLEIKLRWKSPIEARLILDILIEQYFSYRNTVYKPQKVRNFYDQTVNAYQQDIDEQQQQKILLINQIKATDAHTEIESNLTLIKEYRQQLGPLELSRLTTGAQVELLTAQLNQQNPKDSAKNTDLRHIKLFANIDNPAIRALAGDVQKNLTTHVDLSKDFLPTSSVLIGARRKLDSSYAILLKEVTAVSYQQKGKLKAISGSIGFLQQRISELTSRNVALAKLQVKLEKVNRDQDLLEASFANYYKLREEATMMERTQDASLNTQVILLTPAWANHAAVFPNKMLLIPFGLIIALLVGLTAGLVIEYFDDTIKRPDDSLKLIGVPNIVSLNDLDPASQPYRSQAALNWLVNWFKHLVKNRRP